MEDIVVAVIEVNHVGARNSPLNKRQMIVFYPALVGIKVGLVTSALSGSVDQIQQPWSTVRIAQDIKVGVADHVHYHERFDLFQRPILFPSLGKMTRAIIAVGIRPSPHSLFPIAPDQPDAISIALLAPQLIGELKQDCRGRSAIIRSDVSDTA